MTSLTNFPWTAEADGNVYTVTPDGRKHVGMMASRDLAEEAADSHNAALAAGRASARGVHGSGWTGVQVGDFGSQTNIY
jgi:hypothetical protein